MFQSIIRVEKRFAAKFKTLEHKRRKLIAVSVVVAGGFVGLAIDHTVGFGLEAFGLYLVELV